MIPGDIWVYGTSYIATDNPHSLANQLHAIVCSLIHNLLMLLHRMITQFRANCSGNLSLEILHYYVINLHPAPGRFVWFTLINYFDKQTLNWICSSICSISAAKMDLHLSHTQKTNTTCEGQQNLIGMFWLGTSTYYLLSFQHSEEALSQQTYTTRKAKAM